MAILHMGIGFGVGRNHFRPGLKYPWSGVFSGEVVEYSRILPFQKVFFLVFREYFLAIGLSFCYP